ncbi:hypothetical protein M406DRAFT_43009 [Cryphonectria parasitica EP155]|uniref:Uncharacterized protein n=1 Tax=Cryphonectria parasitica (strain ATCC 38755 / EP155) TaxID=660469 RepID=A0A9P5CNN1_CRYP1|nr:uncharacterized protein M406DRAFT_43009 [Cryphonectria parasitica EP155]KAF3764301.1 hypothetical protein M406DRAFT_43009 [Cryphonectria parasitica EP155]
MASDSSGSLTPVQLHALFDILNHHETYREVESFKHIHAIREYGYPFTEAESLQRPSSSPTYRPKSSSPLLQLLLTRCILTIPGMSDLPADFWSYNFQGIMVSLAEANLSESYDKGTLGTRKTLATGASVIHEALTRGLLGGVPKSADKTSLKERTYDVKQASELERAWNDCICELIHGDLADELFDHCAETADLEAHSPAVAAAVDYAILHLASLMHHVFVLSSEGQYLLKLIENVFKLVPFSSMKTALRVGNAATMINGMVRLFLAKMSVGAMTNWMGLTSGADDGMNLMQRIISAVLSWDASDFRKQAGQVESAKERPTKEQFTALKEHLNMPAEAHRAMREISMALQKSIVAVIFEATDPEIAASLTQSQHTQCLDWLSATLSARDRDEMTKVLCRSNPDCFTAAVRGAVSTYEPFIRSIHETLDLREHVTSVETFVPDFIETSKPKKAEENRPPSVEDYVALLRRNKHLFYNYCHDFAKNCTDLRERFQTWAHIVVGKFNQQPNPTRPDGAGAMNDELQDLYTQLPTEAQEKVLAALNVHASYLSKLDTLSSLRMQRPSSRAASPRRTDLGEPSMTGPGVYLMRWESLLDETLITPAVPSGPVRHGKDVKGQKAWGKTVAEDLKGGWDAGAIASEEDRVVPLAPDSKLVVDVLGQQFRDLVNDKIEDVVPAARENTATVLRSVQESALEVEGIM